MNDAKVKADDARPFGNPGECFYCRAGLGSLHRDDCVILRQRILDETPIGVWQPIETYKDGNFAIFWFEQGEKGIGGMETAIAFRDDDGVIRSGWTHGGPNSGSDFEFCEPPSMWCRPPDPPTH